jgi:paraquat-inducible protein B
MAEPDNTGPPGDLPVPAVTTRSRFSPSLVWLVPLVAAIAGLVLVVKTYSGAGPKIAITFQTAEGIQAGKTEVRYKEVVIGTVRGVDLSEDHSRVVVHVHLDRRAADFAVKGSRFWVVRPRVGVAGVTGLSTLFSGSYIGADAGDGKQRRNEFTGLETPPAVLRGNKGRSFVLRSDDLGSLDIGSPVYFRRLRVGHITSYQLSEDGSSVSMHLFVDAPYDHYVTASSRFWNASGIDLTLNASGLKLNTESLATVVAGGVAFQSIDGGSASEAAQDTAFELHRDVSDALKPTDGPPIDIRMRFNETLRGLTVGSPIDFRGIIIGNVKSIELDYEPETQTFPADVIATIYPRRLGRINDHFAQSGGEQANTVAVLQSLVEHGFRAQARTGNLLTQQLYIALAHVPKAAPVKFDPQAQPLEIPTAPGSLEEIQKQLSAILGKLEKVPFDEIGTKLRDTLSGSDALMRKLDQQVAPQARQTLEEAQRAMQSLQHTLADDSPLQRNTGATLEELRRAAQSLRALSDYLQRHPEALLRGKQADPAPEPATAHGDH